jgi:hypothetical protein
MAAWTFNKEFIPGMRFIAYPNLIILERKTQFHVFHHKIENKNEFQGYRHIAWEQIEELHFPVC